MFYEASNPDFPVFFLRLLEIVGRLHSQPHCRAAAERLFNPQGPIRSDRTLPSDDVTQLLPRHLHGPGDLRHAQAKFLKIGFD